LWKLTKKNRLFFGETPSFFEKKSSPAVRQGMRRILSDLQMPIFPIFRELGKGACLFEEAVSYRSFFLSFKRYSNSSIKVLIS